MTTDRPTKVLLGLIALALWIMVLTPFLSSKTTIEAAYPSINVHDDERSQTKLGSSIGSAYPHVISVRDDEPPKVWGRDVIPVFIIGQNGPVWTKNDIRKNPKAPRYPEPTAGQ